MGVFTIWKELHAEWLVESASSWVSLWQFEPLVEPRHDSESSSPNDMEELKGKKA